MSQAGVRDQQRRLKLPEMEGAVARWYARNRGSAAQMDMYRKQAKELTEGLPSGARVLEVAPGPGFLAIEMARLGRFHITGLDISRTFVQIASDNAGLAAVSVDFRRGDVADMPLDGESFDLIVCQAAFKNFTQPIGALNEMYRVLRRGGIAVIQDLSRDASHADIEREVKTMKLGRLNAFMTKGALEMLRGRAYTRARFERVAAESVFRTCHIQTEGIGIEVRLKKEPAA